LRQLFDSLDPSPLDEKDLDRNVEAYVVESAKELSTRGPCTLVVHLDQPPGSTEDEEAVGTAIRGYFARRATLLHRDFRTLIRRGRTSLLIGVAFLSTLVTAAQLVERFFGSGPVARIAYEGLLIAGWVAMWRPIEIFLYDWWPILGERRLYERLSGMKVRMTFEDGHRRPP
jgi:hypothetical protein